MKSKRIIIKIAEKYVFILILFKLDYFLFKN